MIIVYDVGIKRVNRLKMLLRQHLNWIQNSVFEGEITESEFREIERLITNNIEKSHDHVVVYVLNNNKYLDRHEFGTPKLDSSNII